MHKGILWLRRAAAAATLIVALLLCWQCIDIYRDGISAHQTAAFSREIVAERLSALSPVMVGYAALVLAAVCLRGNQAEQGVKITVENRLRLVKARVLQMPEAALKEERKRRRICAATLIAMAVCAVGSLSWLLNRGNFISWDLEAVLGRLLLHAGPWIAAAFVVAIAAAFACDRSRERELAILKDAPKRAAEPSPEARRVSISGIRIALFVVAAVFIVLGVMNGGAYDVLVKAVNICTECIGLG